MSRGGGRAPALLVDIGGTNARFALTGPDGSVGDVTVFKTSAYESFEAALAGYLASSRDGRAQGQVRAVAVCAAGPVSGGRVNMTNCPWAVSVEAMARVAGTRTAVLMNDFEAVAWSLPVLDATVLTPAGGPQGDERSRASARLAAVGPGTGLGVGALVPDGRGGRVAIAGEGGHANLAALDEHEGALLRCLARRHGHVCAEYALSGPGLANIYRALGELEPDGEPEALDEQTIASRAAAGEGARSAAAVRQFTAWLGDFAGDAALTFGAVDGMFIAGGIVPSWGDRFDRTLFRERFERKGRYRDYMTRIPTWIIAETYCGLKGLAHALESNAA